MSDSQSTTNRSDNGDQDNPRLTARRSPQPETPREFYPEGERHDRLFQIARLLLSQGLTIAAVEEEVVRLNAGRCAEPLSEQEVHKAVEFASTYGREDGRDGLEMLSAPYRERVEAERNLRFRTAAEIADETPSKPNWITKPWVAPKTVTAVDGKPKAAGKTTWLLRLIRCVLGGERFMGQPTTKTPVVYLTEEGEATFREALDRADLLGRHDLHVLYRSDAWGVPWPEVVKAAVKKCHEVGAGLLVVDTVAPFAGLKGDKENNAGDQQQAFEPLAWARDQGLAVIANRHERKSSGDVGDSARGSNAFTAAADVIISIRRPEGHCLPTIREIKALSRFSETPESLTIDLTDHGYEILGDSAAVAVARAEEAILQVAPQSADEAMPLDDLKAATGLGRTTTQRALDSLVSKSKLLQTGKGVKGAPRKYHRPIHSAQTPTPIGAERIESTESEVVQ